MEQYASERGQFRQRWIYVDAPPQIEGDRWCDRGAVVSVAVAEAAAALSPAAVVEVESLPRGRRLVPAWLEAPLVAGGMRGSPPSTDWM